MPSVHQHWDPLEVCVVGRSYSPKFYDYIQNTKARQAFYRIAEETEEDYQTLISLLESFDVKILRPELSDNYQDYILPNGRILFPPVAPRDVTATVGNNFYIDLHHPLNTRFVKNLALSDYYKDVNAQIKYLDQTFENFSRLWQKDAELNYKIYKPIIDYMQDHATVIYNKNISSAQCVRMGKDLLFGSYQNENLAKLAAKYTKMFPDYRCRVGDTEGHADGTFCVVTPGLILAGGKIDLLQEFFPDWEIVQIENPLLDYDTMKDKTAGRWWVSGEENNDDLINYVEQNLDHWLGNAQESVFDINMLIVDPQNIICNSYNEQVFAALERYDITPHILNFRHKNFWDGGLHCITSDLSRIGDQKDYHIF
jgi:hypothetical protein